MRLIDADKLKTALHERFHEEDAFNNITMVPLGEVIKFCNEQPAVIDMNEVIESITDAENRAFKRECEARELKKYYDIEYNKGLIVAYGAVKEIIGNKCGKEEDDK